MGIFNRKKTPDVLDLSERYRRQQARAREMQEEVKSEGQPASSVFREDSGGFGFFGAIAKTASENSNSQEDYVDVSAVDERRKKLAKRLIEMTTKIEELSNQIYHLQQRIEVLERKGGVRGF